MYTNSFNRVDRKFLIDGAMEELRFIPITATATPGPVIQYTMTPQGRDTLFDQVGSMHGMLTNFTDVTQAWGSNQNHYVVAFDGTDDYVSVAYDTPWDWTSAFTIVFWYNPSTLTIASTNSMMISYGGSTDENFISLNTSGSAYPYFSLLNDATQITVNSNVASTVGQWTHVVCTVGSSFMGIYVNGTLADSRTDVVTPLDATTSGDRYLGIWTTGDMKAFNGMLSDVEIYNFRWTPTQVTDAYNATFEERSGLTWLDLNW